MNLRLTIEGSASQLAMILASLPDGVAVGAASPSPAPVMQPQPVAQPAPSPVPPMPTGQPASDDDGADDSGPVNANAPAVDTSGLPWDERIHASTKTTKADGTWTGRRGAPKGAEYDAIVAELRARVAQPMPSPQPAPVMQQPVPMPAPQPIPAMPMPAPNAVPHAAAPIPMPVAAPADMAHGAGAAAPVYSPPPMPEQVAQQPQPVAQPMPMPAPQPMPQPAPEPVQTAVAAASAALDFAQFMQHLSGQMTKRDGNGAPLVHADYLAGITAEISQAFGQQLSAITDIAANPQMITFAMQAMQRDQRW